MKTKKLSTEDRLVRNLTAFPSMAEMLVCLRNGYVPTLRRSPSYQKLDRIIKAKGFKTFLLSK